MGSDSRGHSSLFNHSTHTEPAPCRPTESAKKLTSTQINKSACKKASALAQVQPPSTTPFDIIEEPDGSCGERDQRDALPFRLPRPSRVTHGTGERQISRRCRLCGSPNDRHNTVVDGMMYESEKKHAIFSTGGVIVRDCERLEHEHRYTFCSIHRYTPNLLIEDCK